MKQTNKNWSTRYARPGATMGDMSSTPADFGLVGYPKDGDAVQVNIPGQNDGNLHPAMAGAIGQTINLTFNTPSPHLTFKEWMARGVMSGFGRLLAFPFAFAGTMINGAGLAILGLLKFIAIVVLIPTLLWLGYQLEQKISHANSIEDGAAMVSHDARQAVHGVGKGLTDDQNNSSKR